MATNKPTGTPRILIPWLVNQDPESRWDITPHREKRSLSQNAYYWTLIGKMAPLLNISNAELHNRLLRRYGQIMIISGMTGTTYLQDDDRTEQAVLEAETFHLKPTSTTITDRKGRRLRGYVIMRGSSDYNSAEMSALLQGAVSEAQEMGIETLTPEELARMKINEQKKEAKRVDH